MLGRASPLGFMYAETGKGLVGSLTGASDAGGGGSCLTVLGAGVGDGLARTVSAGGALGVVGLGDGRPLFAAAASTTLSKTAGSNSLCSKNAFLIRINCLRRPEARPRRTIVYVV